VKPDRWDLLATAVALLVVLADLLVVPGVSPLWAAAVTEVPAAAALLLRRSHPLLCLAIAALAVGVELSLGVPGNAPLAPPVVIVMAMYSVAVHLPLRRALLAFPILAVLVAAGAVVAGLGVVVDTAALGIAVGLAAWIGGATVRVRTERAVALAREIDRREHAHAHALLQERTRIARELHDVVAHAISVMVVQAGAAESVLDKDPAQARTAIAAVQATGRQAVTEMGRVVGLLRTDRDDVGLAPMPGLADLDELVEHFRAAGLPVELAMPADRLCVDPAVEMTAYRVVQEGLTNALKHGPRERVTVAVDLADDQAPAELRVEIDDHRSAGPRRPVAPAAGTGHGIDGMRERVTLLGGSLDTAHALSGFRVAARLPVPTQAP
jgi:signal transduction histidine kinase